MSLVSSAVGQLSIISKGVVSDSERIRSSFTSISMSPVGILFDFALLSRTTPLAARTYSERTEKALSKTVLSVVSSKAS